MQQMPALLCAAPGKRNDLDKGHDNVGSDRCSCDAGQKTDSVTVLNKNLMSDHQHTEKDGKRQTDGCRFRAGIDRNQSAVPPLPGVLCRKHEAGDDIEKKSHGKRNKGKAPAVLFVGHPVAAVMDMFFRVGKEREHYRNKADDHVQGQNHHIPEQGRAHIWGDDHIKCVEGFAQILKNRDAGRDNTSQGADGRNFDKGLQGLNVPEISNGEYKDTACRHRDEELKASHVESPGKTVAQVSDLHALNQLIDPRRKSCGAHSRAYDQGSCFFGR